MQVDVGEQRAGDPALWGAALGVLEQLPFHDPGPEEFPDQVEELGVLDTPPEQLDEPPVVDRVEVRRDVALDRPEEPLGLVALQVRYLIASMVRRLGRNPKDCWTKSASKMGSKAIRSAS